MEDKEKGVSIILKCRDVEPKEKDRPLNRQALLAGEVLKQEWWCRPDLSGWRSGAQQGWQLEAEGQE